MQSLHSILAPAASAARHLAQALATARSDFAMQANKTRRRVADDLDEARDEAGEAAARLSEVLDHAVAAIRDTTASYRDDARLLYGKHRNDKLPGGSGSRSRSLLIAGTVLGLSYAALRIWRGKRAQSAKSTSLPNKSAEVMDGSVRKRATTRRKRPAASTTMRKEANGAGEIESRRTH